MCWVPECLVAHMPEIIPEDFSEGEIPFWVRPVEIGDVLCFKVRQNLLDPIEAMLEFNGVKDIQLRFRNTILTTLDSGSGTTKNLA